MDALKNDLTRADISLQDRAILDFALKLTKIPNRMAEQDLHPLREQGLDDTAILEVAHIVGFFNHINRVADALGVDPEPSDK